ncbi:restriction endonuclease subunit S [Clostridium sp. MD294]|uniref:restriction endonuclease subunit S n=1 Tax=Clostridium sp. MD294 TaxID=97138 RepID=UPI0002C9F20D|nr:restriction endonuclease subunit S [Clostridium sp. MD294]NDO45395.1 restriction endonuclease subunit S [Clostridium sp. MD294]USF30960.1 hypothetical protein C820_002404 [Clostridium sp. MD294]
MIKKGVKPQLRFAGFKEDWQRYKWSDTVDISTEMVDPNTRKYDELPHVAPGNIESFTGQLYDNIKLVKYENLISGKFHFYNGDIIYGKINPQLCKYILAKFEGLTSADAYVLNAKNGIVQQYLYAILQTRDFFNYSISVSKRSGIPKINRDELNVYSFLAPCEEEQKQIGNMLLKLDDIITLYKRKYDKLTNIKKSMLEKMFPKKGSSVPEIRFKGFSDNWQQRKLEEVANYRRGSFPQPYGKSEWYDGDGAMPFVQVADVSDEMNLVEDTKQKISKLAQPMSVFAEKNSVLVTLQGSIGRVAITQYGAFVDRTVLIFEEYKEEIDNTFWAYIIKQKFIDEARKAPGGTIKTITKEALSDFDLSIPSYQEQKQISTYFSNLNNLITLHKHKLEKLKDIKKAYIEKMFI